MDIYKTIEPSEDLDTLEKEMLKWSLQPHDIRMRSDEECIRQYGKTNIELYNDLKASILDPVDPSKTKTLKEGFVRDNITDSQEDIASTTAISMDLNTNPNIAVIDPNIVTNIEDLKTIYMKYVLSIDKYKRFSNYYSQMLFGYNVPNMYTILLNKFKTQEDQANQNSPVLESTNIAESMIESIKTDINRAVIERDQLALYHYEIMLREEASIKEMGIVEYEAISKEYFQATRDQFNMVDEDFSEFSAVPWFTLNEKYGDNLDNFYDNEYSAKLAEAGRLFKANRSEDNRQRLLDLGWNPEVPVTMESVRFAKERQAWYLNKKIAKVIDLTHVVAPISESSTLMRKLYREKDLYPVYIALTFTNTTFGKIIRFVKNSTYTHAGISLDSDLRNILTFKFNSNSNGFEFESIDEYIRTYDGALLQVLCIFVDGSTKRKLEEAIKWYIAHKDDTRYGFKNLINILLKRKKNVDDWSLELVCSQFVDHILKICGVDITKKPNNLVIPQDYATIANDNPRVYKLYEGLATEYNERKVEGLIETLYTHYQDIKYVNESTGLEFTIALREPVPAITTTLIEKKE